MISRIAPSQRALSQPNPARFATREGGEAAPRPRPRLGALVRLPIGAILGVALFAGATAEAARPRTLYVPIDSRPRPEVLTNHSGEALVIYMNRHGGTYHQGNEDSRTNSSSISNPTSVLAPFPYDDGTWNEVMKCMREIYAPFNIVITDEDPGDHPHMESVVAGKPQDLGMPGDVGGVAPFSCGVIENAIVFTFPAIWQGNARDICETAAQETAHAFGLDHEFLCEDPMTYLVGCGKKRFQDINAQCGEYEPRGCQCGGSTQNSYAIIGDIYGFRPRVPPTVEVAHPRDGARVTPEFVIDIRANDDVAVDYVEVFVDGQSIGKDYSFPFGFSGPAGMAEGAHQIVARAVDVTGDPAETSIVFEIGPPCSGTDGCASGDVCVSGRCVPGPGSPGGLGEECTTGTDCFSGLCGEGGDGHYCAEVCTVALGDEACPGGFTCLETGGGNGVCWSTGSGGCCAVVGGRTRPTSSIPWAAVALSALALVTAVGFRRRRG